MTTLEEGLRKLGLRVVKSDECAHGVYLAETCDKCQRKSVEAKEVEQLRVQLAGCSVAAMGGDETPNRATRGMYGWSVAYDDVAKLYREKEDLRSALARAEKEREHEKQYAAANRRIADELASELRAEKARADDLFERLGAANQRWLDRERPGFFCPICKHPCSSNGCTQPDCGSRPPPAEKRRAQQNTPIDRNGFPVHPGQRAKMLVARNEHIAEIHEVSTTPTVGGPPGNYQIDIAGEWYSSTDVEVVEWTK